MTAATNSDAGAIAGLAAKRSLTLNPAVVGTVLAGLFALPIIALIALALSGDSEYLDHIASTRLTEFSLRSAQLALTSGALAAVIGVGCAWLVTRFEFAGRRALSWLLILPLAMPGYVAAYSWYAITAPGSKFEAASGWDLPTVSGISGASFIFALTLYPYVYLLSRNAMEAHGRLSWDVARSLGAGPWRAFRQVILPLTWPAAAAGTALVIMEVLADYGVADFLGVSTLTVGIVRAWSSFGDPAAAAQLAVFLLFGALLALGLERAARGRRQFASTSAGDSRQAARARITGWRALSVALLAALPLILGLLIPAGNLAWLASQTRSSASIVPALQGTIMLAAFSGMLAMILGLTAAYALRSGNSFARSAIRLVQSGYAVPGAVAAIAILSALVFAQMLVSGITGSTTIALTGGSIVALLIAYQSRFAAVAILPSEAALMKVRRELDEAARSLGASPMRVVTQIHLPLVLTGLATAGLLVAIEVMKELPATMILRPFSLDTLAVTAHNYASDERLAQAAFPALILIAICIPATALLNLVRPDR
ncbi:Fe(3+)-transport system permease protein SfuB [Altererythrobacter insulae]|nr:Fe(3+)-transport system permease protein SfuB [Altererythrobacter insulae]